MKISTTTILSLLGTLCLFEASSASSLRVQEQQRGMQEEEPECRPRLWKENGPAITGPDLSEFGGQVDISADGQTTAVTAEAAIEPTSGNKTGSLKVYRMNSVINEWVQVGDTIYGTVDNGKFGQSLSMDSNGKLIAVGATGSVSVFFFEGNSTFTLLGGQATTSELPGFGSSVDVSGGARLLAVGLDAVVEIFSIKAFDNPTTLDLIQVIQGEVTTMFGSTLSISDDGNTLAVGAPGTECNVNIGEVVIYTRSDQQQQPPGVGQLFVKFQTLEATDSDEFGDAFGGSVGVTSDGKMLAVGDVDGGNGEFGAVTVYRLFRGEYTQVGQKLQGDSDFPSFGNMVALNGRGNVLAVASPDGGGVVKVYRLINSKTWIRVGQELSGDQEGDQFGSAISLSSNGRIMAIGIEGEDSAMVYRL